MGEAGITSSLIETFTDLQQASYYNNLSNQEL